MRLEEELSLLRKQNEELLHQNREYSQSLDIINGMLDFGDGEHSFTHFKCRYLLSLLRELKGVTNDYQWQWYCQEQHAHARKEFEKQLAKKETAG